MSFSSALVTFPGISQLRSAAFTLSPGIAPSVATLEIVPQPRLETLVGTLSFSEGATELRFPDCRIDTATVVRNQAGMVVRLSIVDRRWRWRYGAISGHYNLWRSPEMMAAARLDASRISSRDLISGTERSPRELCALCLDAMGECDYDLSGVPDQFRPTVAWDYAIPARALAALAEQLGCRVVLRTDNTVAVVPIGTGRELPRDASISEATTTFDPPELPAATIAVCGAYRYQADLPLEAVGQDVDGSIRPLAELSYKPLHDWSYADLDYMNEISDPHARDLARETVFRWYRVASDLAAALPLEWEPQLLRVADILPLSREQIETHTYAGVESAKPAQLFGQWYEPAQEIEPSNSVESLAPVVVEHDEYAQAAHYRKPFDLDLSRGIVMFRESVYRMQDDGNGFVIQPAHLRLRTSFGIRDPLTGASRRFEYCRGQAGANRADARFVSLPSITPQAIAEYDANYHPRDVRHNLEHICTAADDYLEFLAQQITTARPESVAYVGLRAINLDGAIAQVTWSVGLSGTTTRAARFATTNWLVPSSIEQKLLAIL